MFVRLCVFMSGCMFPHSFTKNFDDPIAILFYEGIEILLVREGTFSVLRCFESLVITFFLGFETFGTRKVFLNLQYVYSSIFNSVMLNKQAFCAKYEN